MPTIETTKTAWQVGDYIHPKGAPRHIKERIVYSDKYRVVTTYTTRFGKEQTVSRTVEDMDKYCELY